MAESLNLYNSLIFLDEDHDHDHKAVLRDGSPPPTCHVSCVTCHTQMSHVKCHMSHSPVIIFLSFSEQVVKLVGGGSVINGT